MQFRKISSDDLDRNLPRPRHTTQLEKISMPQLHRRDFLQRAAVSAFTAKEMASLAQTCHASDATSSDLKMATFRFDVTPPIGHPCCGGWIQPVAAVDDQLEAIGLIFFGCGKPIVLCAVDWTGILNHAHLKWRQALAEAAGTTPDRVAVHCVHQHNAPFACLDAQSLVAAEPTLSDIVDEEFFDRCLDRGRHAVRAAIAQARPVTHIAHGQSQVKQVASNRRVFRDAKGNVRAMRGSSCTDPKLQALPEGLIDPWLKTVAFYDGKSKIAACHYYATHPMSYYADGRVSSDFAGLARKQRQTDEPECTHVYFTGCAGNVAAGKYNDGSPPLRPELTERMYRGIVGSESDLEPEPIEKVDWKTMKVLPPPNPALDAERLRKLIANQQAPASHRGRAAYTLAYLQRYEQQIPIVLSGLRINSTRLLHLPGECFVQYQLRAQEMSPDGFVATAAYGDGGPWYIPIREEYPFGGYEVSVAFCSSQIDTILTQGMRQLLGVG
jgi:hypothetical protein